MELRTVFREHPAPVLQPEYPWEGHYAALYGSVLRIGDGYRMYYQSYVDGGGFFVCLAESADGVRWEKPLFRPLMEAARKLYPTVEVGGKVQDFYHRTAELNALSNVVSDYHIPSVIYAPGEEYPYRLFGYTERGYCVAFSKDGLSFHEHPESPVIPIRRYPNRRTRKVWFSDVAPVFYDRRKKVYRAMVKTYRIDGEGRTRRCVGMSTSRDFVRWTRPHTIWTPSEREDRLARSRGYRWADFYGLCPFNWEDRYLGFLWLFMIEEEIPEGTHRGRIEVYLVQSRDCIRWEFTSTEPLIKAERWHSGTVTTASQPLIEDGKIRVYFSGSSFEHGKNETEILGAEDKVRIGFGDMELRYG